MNTESSKNKRSTAEHQQTDLRKQFGELSLDKKIATLLQFEALTMSEAFDAAMQKPLALGTRALDALVRRARSARVQEHRKKQPPETKRSESR